MKLVPFTYERWLDLKLQPEQAHEAPTLDKFLALDHGGEAYCLIDENGHTLMAGGAWHYDDNVAVIWSYVGADSGPRMLTLARESRLRLSSFQTRWPVLRALTLKDFGPGHRLLKLLGFRDLGAAPQTVNGKTYTVYERLRDGGR